MPDGCRRHAVIEDDVADRWRDTEALIAAAVRNWTDTREAKAEERAQWEDVTMCHCCYGPARGADAIRLVLCSNCLEGDDCEVCVRIAACSIT